MITYFLKVLTLKQANKPKIAANNGSNNTGMFLAKDVWVNIWPGAAGWVGIAPTGFTSGFQPPAACWAVSGRFPPPAPAPLQLDFFSILNGT